jgi:hypothetical protein
MKKIVILVLLFLIISPKSYAQKNEGIAVAAAGLIALGAGISAMKKMEERAELKATEWVLSEHQEFSSFSLKTLDFDGKKLKDMSSVSVITYKLQLFTPSAKPKLDGKKYVLFAFTSAGWISEYGIDFSKLMWELIDIDEWMNMMTSYVKVASSEKDEVIIKERLKEGKIVNKGVRVKRKLVIPFIKLDEDMYVVTDYSTKFRLLYNERSLGVFIKKTRNLVQIGRGDIIKIHDFLLED